MRHRSLAGSETASCAFSSDHIADRRHDVWVCRASTDIPAHPLPYLVIGEHRFGRNVRCGIAWPADFVLGENGNGRTNLAGRAIAALQCIAAYEGGLHRM